MKRWLQGLRPPRREEWAPLVLLVLPLRQLWLGWGHGRVTGIAGEPLYTHLYAGKQLQRWLGEGSWGTADLALGAGAWWPEHALVALWQAVMGLVMDEGLAYGGLLFIGVFLAGYGPWRWLQGCLDDPRPLGHALPSICASHTTLIPLHELRLGPIRRKLPKIYRLHRTEITYNE